MDANQKVKELDNSAVELQLTVPKNSVEQEYQKVVSKYAKTLQIKGFRKGKAPIPVLEKKFGEALLEETMYALIEASVESALEGIEEQYKPLQYSSPKLVDEESLVLEKDKQFSFAVSYDVFPQYEIPEYVGYALTVPKVTIADEQVDEELTKLREQNSMVIEKDGPAAADSIVTVDYCELDAEDKPIEDTAREDYVFTVGTEYNIYKFDDDIIGMKAGDTKIIEKSFDEDYSIKEYAGKSVRISVTVKVVKERDIPELDDEFAQDISEEYETLEDLRKATRGKLEQQLENKLRNTKINALYDALLKKFSIALPQSMIAAELENSWRNFISQSQMQEEYMLQLLEMQGKSRDDLLADWRPQAERSLKIQLMLDKITKAESVEVTDDEVAEHEHLFESIEDERQKDYYRMVWKEDHKMQKTIDILLEKNSFTDGDTVSYKEFMEGPAPSEESGD